MCECFFFYAEDGNRESQEVRGLGEFDKRQVEEDGAGACGALVEGEDEFLFRNGGTSLEDGTNALGRLWEKGRDLARSECGAGAQNRMVWRGDSA